MVHGLRWAICQTSGMGSIAGGLVVPLRAPSLKTHERVCCGHGDPSPMSLLLLDLYLRVQINYYFKNYTLDLRHGNMALVS